MSHILLQPVTFGDCDPAGIVFYPNIFRWMDAAFHDMLRIHGGHADLCGSLGAFGIGLVEASAQFKCPMTDGDLVHIEVTIEEWSRRTLALSYTGSVGKRTTFCGWEVRCLFMKTEDGIVASDMSLLRDRMDVSSD